MSIKASKANVAFIGDSLGAYFHVAAAAQSEGEFRRFVQDEISQRGLVLDDVEDILTAEAALRDRSDADIDWNALVDAASQSYGLAIGQDVFFYAEEDDKG